MAPAAPTAEWMTAQEIADAKLPGMPSTRQGIDAVSERENWVSRKGLSRRRAGKGGGVEWSILLLPLEAQTALAERRMARAAQGWSGLPESARMEAQRRLAAVEQVERWRAEGMPKADAAREAATAAGVSPRTLWRWLALAEGCAGEDRLLSLAPQGGRPEGAAGAASLHRESETARALGAQEGGLVAFEALSEDAKRIADARAAALKALKDIARVGALSMKDARRAFVEGWSEGERFGAPPEAAALLGDLSERSLRRWADLLAAEGLAGLAPKWGVHRKGSGVIDADADMRKTVEDMLLAHPGSSLKLIERLLKARFAEDRLPSRRALERWAAAWRSKHQALHLLAANPDAYKARARLVSGDASGDVLRLNQRWEMDSTPNDVMLSDGKRAALIACVDVWSRRAKIVVARTSSAAGIAACLRKAMLAWGVPEQVRTDNGSDYRSEHIARVCAGLEIEQDFCPAFSPERKPHVERFFGTFTRDLVEMLDGFIGHSVAQRQAIEARRTFAERLFKKDAAPPELRMTAAELQAFCDRWCDEIYAQENHGGLGVSPAVRAQSWSGSIRRVANERALDLLLTPAAKDGGWRTVRKHGVEHERHFYIDPALQAHVGRRVQVRLDEEDMGRVLILGEDGGFVCWALNPELAGLSRAEAASILRAHTAKVEKEGLARIREGKKAVKEAMPEILAAARRAHEAQEERVIPFPKPIQAHETPALAAAAEADAARPQAPRRAKPAAPVTEAQVLALEAARPVAPQKRKEGPVDRFRRWEALDARLKAGEALNDIEARFWRAFPASSEYAAINDLIAERGRAAALGEDGVQPAAG